MGDVLKKFGRYFLLDGIALGGMAEIYRARLTTSDGAGRLLVIKRIQAGFGENSEFLQMFKSEIKVTMGFNHPNIVQLYDFGEENNQPYIAMEWVDGKNLRQLMSRFVELKKPFPIELAAYVTELSAAGLHYAHSFRDKISGEALNIVHRDISPQNILISFEGNVKVIDFGIAKATTNSESTRAGVIKGKPSYLSPEQISGESLDGRSDVFALAAVLWELLAGKKLFAGESDLAVLKMIESCQTHVKPPSTINPNVPKELDYIVLKGLTKQRERRYQSAEEMQKALHKFLYHYLPEFDPGELSHYTKDLFKTELLEDRKKIQRLNEKAEQLLASGAAEPISTSFSGSSQAQAGVPDDDVTPTDTSRAPQAAPSGPRGHVMISEDLMSSAQKIDLEPTPLATPAFQQSSRTSTQTHRPTSRPERTSTQVRSSTRTSTQALRARDRDEDEKPGSKLRSALIIGTCFLALASIFGPGLGMPIPFFSDLASEMLGGDNPSGKLGKAPAGARNPSNPGSNPQAQTPGQNPTQAQAQAGGQNTAKPSSIILRFQITPPGPASVTVNGRALDPTNPSIRAPLEAPLDWTVERPGFKPVRREVILRASEIKNQQEWVIQVPLESLRTGFLTIHSIPSADAVIKIDGMEWRRKTPIENEKLAAGNYSLKLINDLLGMEKNVEIQINEGKLTLIDERLEITH